MGMRSCAIAVHFRPRGLALPLLVAMVCPIPTIMPGSRRLLKGWNCHLLDNLSR